MPYIIDGHNLISHLDDIDLTDPNDEAKLVLKLRGFCARTGKRCVVIFDEGLPGGTSGMTTHSVKVVFASSRQTNADRIIMERIRRTKDVKGWTVISSDEEIRAAAEEVGMGAMRCNHFATMLNPPEPQKPHKGIDENVNVSNSEVDEWLSVFDEDNLPDASDPAEPRQPAQPQTPSRQSRKQSTPSKKKSKRKKREQIPNVRAENSTADDVHVSDDDVDAWMDVFGNDSQREPTDKGQATPRQRPNTDDNTDKKSAPDDNSVESWMNVFSDDELPEPTDYAPQRSSPNKQGHFSKKTRREPNVHENMGTSEDVFLSEGEVDAWLDMFKEGNDDD